MNWQHTPYTLPLLIAAGISAGLVLYSWRYRLGAGSMPFVVVMLALVVWSVGYALELASVDLVDKIFWAKIEYLGIVTVPVGWLAFTLQYTGREAWLTRRNLAALAAEPLVALLLVWTNEAHDLIWRTTRLDTSGSFSMLHFSYGPLFQVHVAYSYLLLLGGTLLLLQALARSPQLYRWQALAILIGVLAPWAGNALYISGLSPFPHLDLTPFGYTLTGLVVTLGLLRFRLLDILPVARDAIVTDMPDGVMVLDAQNRIVDLNPAAAKIVGLPVSEAIGQLARQVLTSWPDLAESYRDVEETHSEISLGEDDGQIIYDLRISPMHDRRGQLSGRLVVLRDITERKRTERALVAQKQLFERLVAVARATAERFTLEAMLQNVLDVATSLTDAEHASLFLLSEADVVTHAILARGAVTPAQEQEIVGLVMNRGLSGWVVRNRQAALVADTAQDSRWLALPDAPYTARSALAVPIMSRTAVLGVLTLTHPEMGHFDTEHLELMQAAADQMALALRNAQIYDAQRRLANRQATLYEGLRAVGAYLDPEAAIRVAVIVVARMTGWPAVAVLLPERSAGATPVNLVVRAAAGALAVAEGLRVPISRSITGRAFRTGETQNVPDVSVDPHYVTGDPAVRSELAVLLRRGERVLGVLDVESDRRAAFDTDDVQLAESLGEAIALAVDNARLFQQVVEGRGRLQTLIESSRDGIVLVEMDGSVPVVNAPALELLDVPGQPEDWVDRPVREGLSILRRQAPSVVRAAVAEIRRVQTGDEPPGEGEFDVGPRTVHWLNLPVMSGTVPLGRLVVLHDVTEERLLERMRDDLTHTMVHDLRNPLTSISASLSFLEALWDDDLPPTQSSILEIAQSSTHMMLDLVNAILDISRLESGRMPLDRAEVAVGDLIAAVLAGQLPVALGKDLELERDVPPDLPGAWVDAKLVERVLHNLVGNAVKFTPSGGVVRVTAQVNAVEGRPRILVAVSDTGPGISPDIRDRLFQKFVTGRQEGRGSGLGLTFCKMVIEAHDERIWIESTPDEGVTFFFTLPVVTK
jgi:PAS domain S-box-containing protein